jgi:hypothetical protein
MSLRYLVAFSMSFALGTLLIGTFAGIPAMFYISIGLSVANAGICLFVEI